MIFLERSGSLENSEWQRLATKKIRENRKNAKKMSFCFAQTARFLPKPPKKDLIFMSVLKQPEP
jgi:hypothetical protein